MRTHIAVIGLVTAAVILSGFPLAGAQEGEVVGTTWYVHEFTSPDGSGSYLNFDPPVGEEDQTATDTAATGVDNYVILTPSEAPTDATAEATGPDGEAVVFVKSWNNGPAPRTRVRVFVMADGEEVANSGDGVIQDVLLGAIVEFRIPLTMTAASIPAGATLEMITWIDDANTGMYSPFAYPRGVSEDHAWRFTLPVSFTSAGPSVVEETLDASDTLELEVSFDSSANETRIYHWNTTLEGAAQVDYNATLPTGSVVATLVDAANTTLANTTLDGTASERLETVPAAPGNWTLRIVASEASGSLSVRIHSVPAPEPAVPLGGNATDAGNTTDGNETAVDEAGFIPGLGVPAMIAGLAAGVAIVHAQRRQHRR